jgi:deazaflavin-dependent oxidoreductase (nitroreductase family)
VVIKGIGEGDYNMIDWNKFFTRANVFLYQKTKGHLGSRMGRQSVLLLNTIGRKSGMQHTTTLSYYRDGGTYLVVASNWGMENHPGWYYNLLQNPHTTIQVGPTIIHVEARQALEEEYQKLWELVTRLNNQYIQYQTRMKRKIPIMILTPTT